MDCKMVHTGTLFVLEGKGSGLANIVNKYSILLKFTSHSIKVVTTLYSICQLKRLIVGVQNCGCLLSRTQATL
jgi:hypothetical protein